MSRGLFSLALLCVVPTALQNSAQAQQSIAKPLPTSSFFCQPTQQSLLTGTPLNRRGRNVDSVHLLLNSAALTPTPSNSFGKVKISFVRYRSYRGKQRRWS